MTTQVTVHHWLLGCIINTSLGDEEPAPSKPGDKLSIDEEAISILQAEKNLINYKITFVVWYRGYYLTYFQTYFYFISQHYEMVNS